MSYSLPIKKGSDWAYTIQVPNSAGWSLRLHVEQNGSFDTPDIDKAVTATDGRITVSGTAGEYGKYKDSRFRVVGTKGNRTKVLQSGEFTAQKEDASSTIDDSGKIAEGLLPARLSEATLKATSVAAIQEKSLDGRYVALGDSITANGGTYGISWANKLPILSRQQARLLSNAGVGGNTSSQMLARFDTDVTAKAPRYVLILCGANDSDMVLWQSNVAALVAKARVAGIIPVVCTLTPHNDPTPALRFTKWNSWLRYWARHNRVKLIDFHKDVVNPATGAWKAGLFTDSLHPNGAGHTVMAQTAAAALASYFPPSADILTDYGSASGADGVNLVANPLLADSNSDGTPDFWTWGGAAASGVTRSLATDARLVGTAAKVVVTSGATGGQAFSQTITAGASTFQPGDILRGSCRLVVEGMTGVPLSKGVTLYGFCNGSNASLFFTSNLDTAIDGIIEADVTIPAGTTSINYTLNVDLGNTGAGTVYGGQFSLVNLTKNGLLTT